MMPPNHILRKSTAGYKLSKSQEKTNHFMYIDDIKLFAKNEKESETLIQTVRIYSQDIKMEFDRKILHANNENWQTTHNGRSRTIKSSSNKNIQRKGNQKILGDIGS